MWTRVWLQAAVKIDQIYTSPIHHHNPMEPHATMAIWDGDRLTLHDATQHVSGVRENTSRRSSASPKRTFM